MWEGEGDNESEPDFSKNAGLDEEANSERGDIGFDGARRNDRSLYNFSPDRLLPVMCSKSTLYRKKNICILGNLLSALNGIDQHIIFII